ncbi:hypothetical protein T4D_5069 [Trichinella pseudospiralis]|uniref:Uncharacterized protein n=1 Tax=Trichinella pseudospiralis TaxID=6337 RepID=A0A0V1FU52_TRIPS|nr:hypothetical protein T4D_5069 [Trichinella pseudospiralis]
MVDAHCNSHDCKSDIRQRLQVITRYPTERKIKNMRNNVHQKLVIYFSKENLPPCMKPSLVY